MIKGAAATVYGGKSDLSTFKREVMVECYDLYFSWCRNSSQIYTFRFSFLDEYTKLMYTDGYRYENLHVGHGKTS